ncbi:ankyrin [Clavulina sp. PMI_390]|nr:ankyrin [Clavulina sp. PMI_390]
MKEEQSKIQERSWLAAPDPNKNQDERRRQASTLQHHGQWLLDLPQFQQWLANPAGFFWVSASAGVGKSVLFSRVVDYLKKDQSTSSTALAFFYFDYRDETKQNYQEFLASIVQSFGQTSTSCQDVLRSYEKHTLHASESELETLLQAMLEAPGAKFLAIDAIDECWESERAKSLLPFLRRLARNQSSYSGTIRVFVTSRPEPDIEEALWASDTGANHIATDRIRLGEREEHLITLKNFIHAELRTNRFKGLGWSESFTTKVAEELLDKSDSMFLWVQLQLDQLMKCSEHDARRILPQLPRTLRGTYARILEAVDENRQRTARAVLECIISAVRPLSEEEIGELFLFDLGSIDEWPKCLPLEHIDPKDRKDTVNIFKLLPSSLLRRGAHNEISFIHFTVQEYLLSQPMSSASGKAIQASDAVLAAFGTSREKAHATALIISLSALDVANREKLPSVGQYSDESWFIHAKSALLQHSSIAPALANFLHPESSAFSNWVRQRYSTLLSPPTPLPDWDSWDESLPVHSEEIEPVGQDQPIHWAVRIGSPSDVRRLVSLDGLVKQREPRNDIRNAYDSIGWTPICYAACVGDLAMLDILLEDNDSWALQRVGPRNENLTIIHILLPRAYWSAPPGLTESTLGAGGFTERCVDLLVWPGSRSWSWTLDCAEAIRKLLTMAPNPTDLLSTCDSIGQTPLGQIVASKLCETLHEMELARILIGHGADPEPNFFHFLMNYAFESSNPSIITTFANQYGVDMNKNSGCPLRLAVEEEAVECVQALLDLNVDPNICDADGKGPLDRALEFHPPFKFMLYTKADFERAVQEYKPSAKQQRIYELLKQHGAELHYVAQGSVSLSESSPPVSEHELRMQW